MRDFLRVKLYATTRREDKVFVYFAADYHFGHENIIELCKRLFKNGEDMNSSIVRNHNQRVKEDDVVFHLGDFCFRGGKEGGKQKALYWEKKLNGKIVHVTGNHDYKNNVKSLIKVALMEFGGYQVLAQHKPPIDQDEIPAICDFVICGHVHDRWKHGWFKGPKGDIPVINVGIDVWNYRPVRLDELVVFYDSLVR